MRGFNRSPVLLFQQSVIERPIIQLLQRDALSLQKEGERRFTVCIPKENSATDGSVLQEELGSTAVRSVLRGREGQSAGEGPAPSLQSQHVQAGSCLHPNPSVFSLMSTEMWYLFLVWFDFACWTCACSPAFCLHIHVVSLAV